MREEGLYQTQMVEYVNSLNGQLPPALSELFVLAKKYARDFGREGMSISEFEGRLLHFFVQQFQCKKFVEVGTFTAYSALWIISALSKSAKFWTLEKDRSHIDKAGEVLSAAHKLFPEVQINLLEGDAKVSLEKLSAEGPFDGIFIDGNKSAYGEYLSWAEASLQPGALILADNVFLRGAVWGNGDGSFSEKQAAIMLEFNRRLSDQNKFQTIFLPTTEGLAVAIKK